MEKQIASDAKNTAYCSKSGDIVLDIGHDDLAPVKMDRNESAIQVMDALDSGSDYAQVRKKHRLFCFWHSALVKGYIKDNSQFGPTSDVDLEASCDEGSRPHTPSSIETDPDR